MHPVSGGPGAEEGEEEAVSITRVDGGFTGFDLICDECGETVYLDYDWDQFKAAVADAKEMGWKIRKNRDGQWENICPECQEAERERG